MSTEIELKYLVSSQADQQSVDEIINSMLAKKQLNFTFEEKALANRYFDTQDQRLRQLDFGYRIRTVNGCHEQTIKTAGVVVGGLHQRPEFNVDIEQPIPNLSLFPQNIWPDNYQSSKNSDDKLKSLQDNLLSLFTTNFTRKTWLITDAQQNVIELAFDQGTIESGGKISEISELELELVSGEREALFLLANLLFECLLMRPGLKSKAARGYALWLDKTSQVELTPFELVPLGEAQTIEQAFIQGLNFSLTHLQQMVDAYLAAPKLAYLSKIVELMALLRHGFWMFEQHLPANAKKVRDELSYFLQLFKWVDGATYIKELTDKTGNYRKRLEFSEQLFSQLNIEKRRFPEQQHVTELLLGHRFNALQLSSLQLLLQMSDENQEQSNSVVALFSFAKSCLNNGLENVFSIDKQALTLTEEQYLQEQKFVIRCLLTGSWFGDLYDKTERLSFRGPWLDIKHGLSELQTLWVLQKQLQTLEDKPTKLVNWHHAKVDSLLVALDSSRTTALAMTPYWLSS